MRNQDERSRVYAQRRMAELGETATANEVERIIAEAFRDGAMAEQAEPARPAYRREEKWR